MFRLLPWILNLLKICEKMTSERPNSLVTFILKLCLFMRQFITIDANSFKVSSIRLLLGIIV